MATNPWGRRGKPDQERLLSVVAQLRCSEAEYDELCRGALRERLSVSRYLRRLLRLDRDENRDRNL